MKVYITSEYRFTALPDGSIWTETAFPYSYWQRYLGIFDEVCVVGRMKTAASAEADWKRADGDNVSFSPLPDYVGPLAYFKLRSKLKQKMSEALDAKNAIILSVPSPIALIAENVIRKKKLIYGIEVMGDPWEVFSPSGVQHPLRIYFRHSLTRRMQRQVFGASSVLYVTEKTLQKRYPANEKAFQVGVSNVDLMPEYRVSSPQVRTDSEIRLISVGSLEQMYKNPDIVLHAVNECIQAGINIRLTWLGGGKFLAPMIELANSLGLKERARFLGQVSSGDTIRQELDSANLFVLASKTEGMPRALIEAMARGLPCIGSDVGGIPELLDQDELFAPNDVKSLKEKIISLTVSPEKMNRMAAKNFEKSAGYLKEKLDQKRAAFLQHLLDATKRALK